jgi:hypothetical protein
MWTEIGGRADRRPPRFRLCAQRHVTVTTTSSLRPGGQAAAVEAERPARQLLFRGPGGGGRNHRAQRRSVGAVLRAVVRKDAAGRSAQPDGRSRVREGGRRPVPAWVRWHAAGVSRPGDRRQDRVAFCLRRLSASDRQWDSTRASGNATGYEDEARETDAPGSVGSRDNPWEPPNTNTFEEEA